MTELSRELCRNLHYFAATGTVDQLKGLLITYGNESTIFPDLSALDWITKGVNSIARGSIFSDKKEEKMALVIDFTAKTGVFAKKQEIKPDIVAELRAEFRAELALAIAPLTTQIEELKTLLEEKPATRKAAAKPAVSIPHVRPH